MALEVEKKGLSVGKDLDDSLEFKYEAKPVYSFFKRAFDIIDRHGKSRRNNRRN